MQQRTSVELIHDSPRESKDSKDQADMLSSDTHLLFIKTWENIIVQDRKGSSTPVAALTQKEIKDREEGFCNGIVMAGTQLVLTQGTKGIQEFNRFVRSMEAKSAPKVDTKVIFQVAELYQNPEEHKTFLGVSQDKNLDQMNAIEMVSIHVSPKTSLQERKSESKTQAEGLVPMTSYLSQLNGLGIEKWITFIQKMREQQQFKHSFAVLFSINNHVVSLCFTEQNRIALVDVEHGLIKQYLFPDDLAEMRKIIENSFRNSFDEHAYLCFYLTFMTSHSNLANVQQFIAQFPQDTLQQLQRIPFDADIDAKQIIYFCTRRAFYNGQVLASLFDPNNLSRMTEENRKMVFEKTDEILSAISLHDDAKTLDAILTHFPQLIIDKKFIERCFILEKSALIKLLFQHRKKDLKEVVMDENNLFLVNAITLNKLDMVALLAEDSDILNQRMKNDVTPTMLAIVRDATDALKILLLHKPDLTAKDRNGISALDFARAKKDSTLISMLETALKRSAPQEETKDSKQTVFVMPKSPDQRQSLRFFTISPKLPGSDNKDQKIVRHPPLLLHASTPETADDNSTKPRPKIVITPRSPARTNDDTELKIDPAPIVSGDTPSPAATGHRPPLFISVPSSPGGSPTRTRITFLNRTTPSPVAQDQKSAIPSPMKSPKIVILRRPSLSSGTS